MKSYPFIHVDAELRNAVEADVIAGAVLIATGLVDLCFDGWKRLAATTDTKMDDQLIPLLRKASKALVAVV